MSLRRFSGVAIIILFSGLFWLNYSKITSSTQKVSEIKPREQKVVYYRLHIADKGKSIPASVFYKDQKLITFTQTAGGVTPRQRAAAVTDKLNTLVEVHGDPNKILPFCKNGIAMGVYQDTVLFTADEKSAYSSGISPKKLAYLWTDNIRKAFGATESLKDPDQVVKKVVAVKKNPAVTAPKKASVAQIDITGMHTLAYQQTGTASWYGGKFHGRRAADGSRFDMYQYTAAHRTLPFGSIVKVTNLRNNTSCVVKITDRGPFVKGRIIDLSKGAAEKLGMVGSGTSNVKIEVLGKS